MHKDGDASLPTKIQQLSEPGLGRDRCEAEVVRPIVLVLRRRRVRMADDDVKTTLVHGDASWGKQSAGHRIGLELTRIRARRSVQRGKPHADAPPPVSHAGFGPTPLPRYRETRAGAGLAAVPRSPRVRLLRRDASRLGVASRSAGRPRRAPAPAGQHARGPVRRLPARVAKLGRLPRHRPRPIAAGPAVPAFRRGALGRPGTRACERHGMKCHGTG